ncbi:MAG TPA: trehalose-6-phosphate synthase, partial [Archangium sp.]
MRRDRPSNAEGGWSTMRTDAQGPIHVSVFPVMGVGGLVVLVHDASFLGRREETTRRMLLAAFFLLASAGAAFSLFSVRFARKLWTKELREALTGQAPREFGPLLRDVRSLVSQLASEEQRESRGGKWSAERLKVALQQHLQGERVVIVANREPYIHDRQKDGSIK